jgi:hypothetical protein
MTRWLAAPLLLPFFLATSCCTGAGDDPPAGAEPQAAAARAPAGRTAKVLQAMDAGTYTYVEIAVEGAPTWFAGPTTAVRPGDTIQIPSRELPMRDFRSDTLDRTFEVVYFVNAIRKVGGTEPAAVEAVQQAHATAAAGGEAAVELAGIAKADGGLTVAEIFARGKEAAGEDVVLRGRVVKYNAGILGKNWLHVRDGSGAESTNDITITTDGVAAVGDTVLVRGKLAADRDLGFGYKFDLLIEDAAITVE